jgi:DNA-binding MarR family transcriptional regulator
VGNEPDDAELERLLRQLLRIVIPAAGEDSAGAGAARDGAAAAGAAGGSAAGDSAPQDAAAGDSAPWAGAAGAGAAGDGPPQDAAARDHAASAVAGRFVNGAAATTAGIPQVSSSEARALIELVTARGIAQGELAGLLGLEKSTVSRLAAGLERKGWIRRGRDEGNQRLLRLYLTAEGRGVATRVWAAWNSRQARILSALSAEERAGLAAGLRGLVRGLAAEGLLGQGTGR